MIPPPHKSTLFPYTTLFRSEKIQGVSEVEVMVNLDSTNVKVYEKNLITGQQTTDESDKNGGTRKVEDRDRKSTRLNSSHVAISYAVFCLKKKKKQEIRI